MKKARGRSTFKGFVLQDSAEIPDLQARKAEADRLSYAEQIPDVSRAERPSALIGDVSEKYSSSHSLAYSYPSGTAPDRRQDTVSEKQHFLFEILTETGFRVRR